jgi:hypothetical protein
MKTDKYSPDEVIAALRASGGIRSIAASKLNCSRSTVTNYVDRYPQIAEALEDIEEGLLDLAEAKFIEHIEAGEKTCLLFYLSTKGKHRGYVKRLESTGKDGAQLVPSRPQTDLSALSEEELIELERLLGKAEGSGGTVKAAA